MTASADIESAPTLGLPADELPARFGEAAAARGVEERSYRIAGRGLRLRSAGPALLERLTPSIEHLRVDDAGEEAHVVEAWDGASTGTEPPPTPPGSEDLPPSGIVASRGSGWRAVYQKGVGTLSVIAEQLDRSWYWAPDADRLPEWECSTPIRHLLHLWLAGRGVQFVHAGAVGRPMGGFVIAGRSGSGKSTTTLATLGSDLLYAGDDYVGASIEPDAGPYVHSLYGCGKLETDHVARLPGLRFAGRTERAGALRARRDKTIFYVRDTYPEQVTTGFPLRGIVIPRVCAGGTTELVEIPRTAALRALVPSTMLEIHGTGQPALTMLARVAGLVPSYELRLGSDLERVPAVLADALD